VPYSAAELPHLIKQQIGRNNEEVYMNPRGNRILVAIDGSERSLQTIHYMTQVPCFRRMELNLFHVFNAIPEAYWDLSKEPASLNVSASVRAWEKQQKEKIEDHLTNCRQVLLDADFQPQKIKLTVSPRKTGIARDIIAESKCDYMAVLLRRRGMGRIPGLVMGSVAYKLLASLQHVPLVFAGRKPIHQRLLLALDGSTGAERALEFAIHLLGGQPAEFILVNVRRGGSIWEFSNRLPQDSQNFSEAAAAQARNFLFSAKMRLQKAGYDSSSIQSELITGADSRAKAIVDMAAEKKADTIVLGRRGISRLQEFAMGRVSSKVLHLGRQFTIWLAN
jgi:nucleotide-binding universal stress UspA family protein